MHNNSRLDRRTVLRTAAGLSCGAIAGCAGDDSEATTRTPADGDATPPGQDTLERVAVDGTTLVVELTADAEVDWVNLIWPSGELFGRRDVPAGVQQVTFELGTSYDPGEYRLLALQGEETVVETSLEIRPELEIRDMGVFRNTPEKPWDEVYGESETDALKNGEAFVTVENTGTGPEAVVELSFSGDVPNPIEDPNGSGMHEKESVKIGPGETVDAYSGTFPFGPNLSEEGMGCSIAGNTGRVTVAVESKVTGQAITSQFGVEYTGSEKMRDCEITFTEV